MCVGGCRVGVGCGGAQNRPGGLVAAGVAVLTFDYEVVVAGTRAGRDCHVALGASRALLQCGEQQRQQQVQAPVRRGGGGGEHGGEPAARADGDTRQWLALAAARCWQTPNLPLLLCRRHGQPSQGKPSGELDATMAIAGAAGAKVHANRMNRKFLRISTI